MPEGKTSQSPTVLVERSEEFASLYANNVQIEISVWDLKMIFGQLDQSIPAPGRVEQHTAMAIPWIQAKLLAYYLQANIILHESDSGKISVPLNVQPPELLPLPDELKDNEAARAARAQIEQLRLKLIE